MICPKVDKALKFRGKKISFYLNFIVLGILFCLSSSKFVLLQTHYKTDDDHKKPYHFWYPAGSY